MRNVSEGFDRDQTETKSSHSSLKIIFGCLIPVIVMGSLYALASDPRSWTELRVFCARSSPGSPPPRLNNQDSCIAGFISKQASDIEALVARKSMSAQAGLSELARIWTTYQQAFNQESSRADQKRYFDQRVAAMTAAAREEANSQAAPPAPSAAAEESGQSCIHGFYNQAGQKLGQEVSSTERYVAGCWVSGSRLAQAGTQLCPRGESATLHSQFGDSGQIKKEFASRCRGPLVSVEQSQNAAPIPPSYQPPAGMCLVPCSSLPTGGQGGLQ